MSIGFLSLFFIAFTVIGVFGIILHRTIICRFWRTQSNDRRKECENFDGQDRRRDSRRGTAADRRK